MTVNWEPGMNELGHVDALISGVLPLSVVERLYILYAIKTCGSKEKAAKLLGIGKTTMFRKLKQYAMDDEARKVAHEAQAGRNQAH